MARQHSAPRVALTRQEVVAEALALIDADGVDALTMRRLADRIGVYPTALYWHTGNKASLLAAVCEQVLATMALPPVDGPPWQEWIRTMAAAARTTLQAHPNIVPFMGSQLQVTTSSFPLAESVLTVLARAGFSDRRLTDAYNAVIGFVFGWLFGEPPEADGPVGVPGRTDTVDAYWGALIAGTAAHLDDFDDTHLATVIHPGAAANGNGGPTGLYAGSPRAFGGSTIRGSVIQRSSITFSVLPIRLSFSSSSTFRSRSRDERQGCSILS